MGRCLRRFHARLFAALAATAAWGGPAMAQPGGNTGLIGDEGLIDAILATPNQKTPVPQDNLFATAPGLEQTARDPAIHLQRLGAAALQLEPRVPQFGRPAVARWQPGRSAQLGEPAVRHAAAPFGLCQPRMGEISQRQ